MQPVKQTINGIGGNCFPACIASILELSLDDVPHFFRGSAGGNWTQEQWDHLRSWAEGGGIRRAGSTLMFPKTECLSINLKVLACTMSDLASLLWGIGGTV